MKKNNAKFLLTFSTFLLLSVFSKAQNISIHGKITDNKTGEPITGATVGNGRLGIGTVTSPLGYYSLNVPSDTLIPIIF